MGSVIQSVSLYLLFYVCIHSFTDLSIRFIIIIIILSFTNLFNLLINKLNDLFLYLVTRLVRVLMSKCYELHVHLAKCLI